ncbi:MAG: DUF134 domain-containing protein [Candidatus Howiella sp.]|jgi:predicted DNA-binding protein (UPF0251 family)/predicted Fe-Mo cluster-binding NifX family protein
MARPQRCRRICREPESRVFSPDGVSKTEAVTLSMDEFEVLRLVDLEKKTHEQCAAQMDISRTTVTGIYESARTKLADCVVNGRRLMISGGNYRICDGSAVQCCEKNCRFQKNENIILLKKKGLGTMRIAVTYDNGQVFQHFGHTEQFKFYDVEDGKIVFEQVVQTNGSGHGALAGFLRAHQADVLICGGIGGGAQTALAGAGIRLYGGVTGDADASVKALLSGGLSYNPAVHCDHHGHEHGDGAHSCGEHGCGRQGCH